MISAPMMQPETSATAKVGVLLYDTTVEVDAILSASVATLRARGIDVGGLLQRFGERMSNGKRSMWLDDVGTGRTIRLDRPRGPGATACILDPDALAEAACLLRRAAEARHAVIIVSRFGNAEADGGGMRAEIADAIFSGAVVLIAVRFSLLGDLEGFLGDPATVLLPTPLAIADWVDHAMAIRQPVEIEP